MEVSKKKSKPGRPKQDPSKLKDKAVLLRLESKEKRGFLDASQLAGIPLSAWMRERLRWAASDELQKAGREIPFLKQK